MVCDKPTMLNELGKRMDNAHSYEEWECYNQDADEIAYEISECKEKCGNDACWGLQNSDEIQLAFEEQEADNRIKDTLPDDEW